MKRRILRVAFVVLGVGAGALAAGLVMAHVAIRKERAPLPTVDEVMASASAADLPVSLSWINTASQAMSRSVVLDPKLDPAPDAPYVMSHSSFVLEWADGRILLIDTGMDRDGAIAFGGPIERLSGGEPIQPLASPATRLGTDTERVQAVVFTHLHSDHVGGIAELCRGLSHPVKVFMTAAQSDRPNYTTRGGRRLIAGTPCAQVEALGAEALRPVAGFPGVYVVAAGGHTPGSQIVIAHVQGDPQRTFVFTGDIVNAIDGVLHDVPKPVSYSLFIVPEDRERLAELRHFLRTLHDRGASLLVSHDQRQLEASGVPLR